MIGIYSLGGGRLLDARRALDFGRSDRLGVWPWLYVAWVGGTREVMFW